uniref:TSA: Wollemia nobilis Ref_Wollemi_Transcript_25694_1629 transcribed RNA sequence n=1 Tax=Wollemia nobilis TaxID=56998 RepID=A0A0C9RQ95_9CONI
MNTVTGSPDLGSVRNWSTEYDGGDLGAVVRASRLVCSRTSCESNIASASSNIMVNSTVQAVLKDQNTCCSLYNDMITGSECSMPAILGKLDEHVVQKACCFPAMADSTHSSFCSSTNRQKVENKDKQIMPFSTPRFRREEPVRGHTRAGIESASTLSSPPMSVHLKSPPRPPTGSDRATLEDKVESSSSTVKMDSIADSFTTAKIAGSKRRKIQQRRIISVPAAEGAWNKQGGVGVPSDLWAWRKYGQKPIKGSPYPRGYYRCSSSKGCPARKQIERSHIDPTMLVITYTADHNHAWPTHRNALAGSTRQNAFQDKMQLLSAPNTSDVAAAYSPTVPDNPDTTVSLANQSTPEKGGPNSPLQKECLDKSLDQNEVQNHSTAALGVFRPTHMLDDDLFADLGVLPEYLKDFTIHSDEESASTVVDLFNLFNWSCSSSSSASTVDWSKPT